MTVIADFLDAGPCVLVEVAEAKGSTPREQGAWMLVSAHAISGTIGGGQLEFMAIDRARQIMQASVEMGLVDAPPPLTGRATRLARPSDPHTGEGVVDVSDSPSPVWGGVKGGGEPVSDRALDSDLRQPVRLSIPLGPEIGQCCGGRVEVALRLVDRAVRAALLARAEEEAMARPDVVIFGGGHVGTALAAAFSLLPVRAIVVETRADALEGMPGGVETRLTAVPEELVREAAPGAAFIVLTHDHALDFLIVAEALRRSDAAYVGMIGSLTKKATFRSWYMKTGGGSEALFRRLVSPIGGDRVRDKRPSVIAALAAAEVMTALATHEAQAGALAGG